MSERPTVIEVGQLWEKGGTTYEIVGVGGKVWPVQYRVYGKETVHESLATVFFEYGYNFRGLAVSPPASTGRAAACREWMPGCALMCNRPVGHDGDHIARDIVGNSLAKWPCPTPAEPREPAFIGLGIGELLANGPLVVPSEFRYGSTFTQPGRWTIGIDYGADSKPPAISAHDFSDPYAVVVTRDGEEKTVTRVCIVCGTERGSLQGRAIACKPRTWKIDDERTTAQLTDTINRERTPAALFPVVPEHPPQGPIQSHLLGAGCIGTWSLRPPRTR